MVPGLGLPTMTLVKFVINAASVIQSAIPRNVKWISHQRFPLDFLVTTIIAPKTTAGNTADTRNNADTGTLSNTVRQKTKDGDIPFWMNGYISDSLVRLNGLVTGYI